MPGWPFPLDCTENRSYSGGRLFGASLGPHINSNHSPEIMSLSELPGLCCNGPHRHLAPCPSLLGHPVVTCDQFPHFPSQWVSILMNLIHDSHGKGQEIPAWNESAHVHTVPCFDVLLKSPSTTETAGTQGQRARRKLETEGMATRGGRRGKPRRAHITAPCSWQRSLLER